MTTPNEHDSELGWQRSGSGARDVVLVHGWMTTGAVWDPVLACLDMSQADYVVPDLRGVGASAGPAEHSLDLHAQDIWATIRAAALKRPVLVGHSMGGQIAQRVAVDHGAQLAGLVLINPVPATGLPLPPEALALFRGAGGDAAKLGAILDMATKLGGEARAELVAVAASIDPNTLVAMLDTWRTGGFEEQLAAIATPTLVLSTDDRFLPPDFLDAAVTSKIRGARREHLAGPGHYPLVERPQETAAVIERFLSALP